MKTKLVKAIIFALVCSVATGYMPAKIYSDTNKAAYALTASEKITLLRIKSGETGIAMFSEKDRDKEDRYYQGDKVPDQLYARLSAGQKSFYISDLETKIADVRVFVGKEKVKLDNIHDEIKVAKGEDKKVTIKIYTSKDADDSDDEEEYTLIVERDDDGEEEEEETETTIKQNSSTAKNESINGETPKPSVINNSEGAWVYRKTNGTLAQGWTKINEKWYYFDASGAMKTGWIKTADNKWYYLDKQGQMLANTVVDGFKLGSDGSWIK